MSGVRFVALLRGVNVGPGSAVAMADLRDLLEGLGYTGVRTYLRSGNAVFDAGERETGEIAAAVEERLGQTLGRRVAVVVRTAGELRAVVRDNPLEVREPAKFAVVFLDREPDRERLEGIDPALYAPEEMAVGRRELYVYFPEGLRRPRLPALLDKRSEAVATMRNWNTVTRLLALAEDAP